VCGRVVQHRELSTYARELGINLSGQVPNAPPHYNGAPSQDLLVLRRDPKTGEGRLGLPRWGLIPHWAKDRKIAWKLINARCETVGKTSAFKDAYRQRRCLIPVDGFYEWKKIGNVKQPFLIAMQSGEPFTLAGLWENWKEPATGEMDPDVHHRDDGGHMTDEQLLTIALGRNSRSAFRPKHESVLSH